MEPASAAGLPLALGAQDHGHDRQYCPGKERPTNRMYTRGVIREATPGYFRPPSAKARSSLSN